MFGSCLELSLASQKPKCVRVCVCVAAEHACVLTCSWAGGRDLAVCESKTSAMAYPGLPGGPVFSRMFSLAENYRLSSWSSGMSRKAHGACNCAQKR